MLAQVNSKPLLDAVSRDNLAKVEELLKNGADVNETDSLNRTPLHVAAGAGQIKIVQELLECGANVNTADAFGKTPLHVAAEAGHVEAVRELLEYGANVNATGGFFDKSPLHYAAGTGRLEVVLELLANGAVSANKVCAYGATPLSLARKNGYNEIAEKIQQFLSRLSPLYTAAFACDLREVKRLLRNGADVNQIDTKGDFLLHCVSHAHRYRSIVQELIKGGANLDAVNRDGNTPLHVAAMNNQSTIALELIKPPEKQHGANVNAINGQDQTPLDIAKIYGYEKMQRQLKLYDAKTRQKINQGDEKAAKRSKTEDKGKGAASTTPLFARITSAANDNSKWPMP